MAEENHEAVEIEMNTGDLYREETFTDRRVGTLQKLMPITPGGEPDTSRPVLYVGQTQVLTPAGALPLSFEIKAETLAEAVDAFGDHAQQALENAMKRLEEMRREAASGLIVPGAGGGQMPGGAGGGMPGGGMPGGGRGGGIQMP